MASYHPARCVVCGVHKDQAHISKTGKCQRHADSAMLTAAREIAAREGPGFDAWLAGMSRAVGRIGRPPTPYPPDA